MSNENGRRMKMYNGWTPPDPKIAEGFEIVSRFYGQEVTGLIFLELGTTRERALFLREFRQSLELVNSTQLNLEGASRMLDRENGIEGGLRREWEEQQLGAD